MVAQTIYEGIVNGSLYALIAIGISLIWGVMGLLCFAQGEFLMIGMYVAFFLHQAGVDPVFTAPMATIILFIIGKIIYATLVDRVLKGPKLSQRLLTFGLSMFLTNLALCLFTATYRSIIEDELMIKGNYVIAGINVSLSKLVPFVTCLILTVVLFLFLNKTRYGKAVQAVSMDKEAAALVGIDADHAYSTTFALACAFTGCAGAVLTYSYFTFPTVGTTFNLYGFFAVAMGGFGSIVGAFLGGLLMGLVDAVSGLLIGANYKYMCVCIFYVIVVIFKPKGIFGR